MNKFSFPNQSIYLLSSSYASALWSDVKRLLKDPLRHPVNNISPCECSGIYLGSKRGSCRLPERYELVTNLHKLL